MGNLQSYSFLLFLLSLVAQNITGNIDLSNNHYDNSNYLDPGIMKLCPKNDTMFIKGDTVKTSDFIRKNGDIYNFCSYSTDLKYIYVFALSSLIIDVDVDIYGSYVKLFFIAPTWIVIGNNRKIALDGSKGDYIPKAEDGNDTNIDGQDGEPGLPGGPGGNFFGIGETFVNGGSLTITANGGIGGTGQYGGNGYSQKRARYVDTLVLGKIWCGLYYEICRGRDQKYKLNLQDNHGNFSDFFCQGLYEKENMESCSYKIFGWEGEEGGKGGNGGRGGKGGLPGSIKLLDVMNSSRITTYNILGIYGHDGRGGIGGKSGQDGYNVIYEDFYFLAPPKIVFDLWQVYGYHLGPNGTDGYSSAGSADVVNADVLETYEIVDTLNEYKSWLRNSSMHINKNALKFYRNIDENSYIRDLYNTSQILSEIQTIGEEFNELKSTVNFFPFYESLLRRIYFYVETYKNDSSRDEDRKILKLLYADILGRIFNSNEHAETYLTIKIIPYLETVKDNLQKVGDLIKAHGRFNTVVNHMNELDKYKENYKSQVNKLINKTEQFVDSKITEEVKPLMTNETDKMSKLVSDIIRFKERPLNYEQEILRCGKNLQDSLIVRSNLYFIRLTNKMLITLSDFAEVVSSVVEIGADVPPALRLVEKPDAKTEFSPDPFKALYNKIEAIKREEVTEINDLLQSVLNKTRQNVHILFDVTEEVLIVQKKLQNNNRFLAVNALRSSLLQAVKIKRNELLPLYLHPIGNKSSKAYEHVTKAQSAFIELSRIIKITTLSRGFVDIYNEYKHDENKLDTVIEYIDKAYDILHIGKKHEDSLYVLVYQLLQNIEDNIVLDASNSSDKITKLAVEVINWNIPLILKNINKKSKDLIDSYPNKDYYLLSIIENIRRACSAFINVFDRLENYLDQKKLEKHVLDYAGNKGITFTNVLFANKYKEIEKSLGSSIILQHYKKATDTFKQYVFPIADFYFKDIILPSYFNLADDIENTVYTAISQIDKMIDKVGEYKQSMLNGDGIMQRKDFGGRQFRSKNPFFIWKSDKYKDMIEKLLSGNKVTVSAEISKNVLEDYAIKFNNIDFYFTSNNSTVHEKINEIMEYFEINAVHLGNSHYCYGEEMYLITSDNFEMSYTYERDESTGNPVFAGNSYEFIQNVDITLSPYAMWQISLTELWEDVTFADLLVLKDYLDLEMGGNGFYISKEKQSTLDLKVSKYYKPLDKSM